MVEGSRNGVELKDGDDVFYVDNSGELYKAPFLVIDGKGHHCIDEQESEPAHMVWSVRDGLVIHHTLSDADLVDIVKVRTERDRPTVVGEQKPYAMPNGERYCDHVR